MNDALQNLLRPHYRDLQGYVSAGMEADKSQDLIFLNANENPHALPGLEACNRYPQPRPAKLLEAYGRTYGVKPAQIMATRGADEAINLLIRAFCEPGQDKAAIHSPTFGIYAIGTRAMPAEIIDVPLIRDGDTFALNVQGIIEAADNAKMIFLCSPNNPTGTSFAHEDIVKICKAAEGKSVVVLDETYAEFAQQGSLSGQLEALPNLIILRTLSKSYALAGMRMGSMLCADEAFIALMQSKVIDVYPLPGDSIQAAITALEHHDLAMKNIQTLIAERQRMEAAWKTQPLVHTVFESDANFLLIEMDRATEFSRYCAEHNVMLRDFSKGPATPNCVRITIGTAQENDRVLELLENFNN